MSLKLNPSQAVEINQSKSLKERIRYFMFLLKWFIIGKNHCDLPRWAKKSLYFFHKAIWIFICLSVAFTSYYLLEYFFPFNYDYFEILDF